jgi:hypothetical protein
MMNVIFPSMKEGATCMMFSSKKKSGCGKFGPMRVDGDGDSVVE